MLGDVEGPCGHWSTEVQLNSVKDKVGCFLLGVATGVLGAVLYQRLNRVDLAKAAENLSEKLEDNVAELESRIASLLGEVTGNAEATS